MAGMKQWVKVQFWIFQENSYFAQNWGMGHLWVQNQHFQLSFKLVRQVCMKFQVMAGITEWAKMSIIRRLMLIGWLTNQ